MGKRKDIELAFASLSAPREENPRLRPLSRLSDNAAIADYLRAERQKLIAHILAGASESEPGLQAQTGTGMAREFSDLVDAVLTRMFALACRRAGTTPTELPISIVATGGYGRRELCPYSDVDLTFIPLRDGDPIIEKVIRDLFSQAMDIFIERCGLEVGYAYRLMEDCGSLDHQTVSGLLDARLIAGNQRIFIQFEDAYWEKFNHAEFIFAKIAERRKILEKWGRTPRVVEPQLKEGAGGLRDLQTAIWLTQAREQRAAGQVRGERAFDTLVREDYLTHSEAERLAAAKELLFRTRNALHAVTEAERDQLVVTRQEDVANVLGYEPNPHGVFLPPVEQFMGDLYPALALVRRLSERIIQKVEHSRLILGIGLDCKRKQIVPANQALVSDDATWLLWAFELAQRYGLEMSDGLERAISALLELKPLVPEPEQSGQVFTRILSNIGKIYPTLQRMADSGVLGWLVPEFGRTMDLIPYDPSHEYAVGQHTLHVIRNLEQLLQPGDEDELTEMRRLIHDIPHPERLMLAALLHDVGKAVPDTAHAESGEVIAANVCRRLGWSAEATATVRFLVRHHLFMAETSRLRDPSRDETIREFLQVVTDIDQLNYLYLLTYADTKAVGEGVWTQVKGRFLRDLWRRALAALSDEDPLEHDEATLARARYRVRKDLSLSNYTEAEIEEHTQAMPSYYLLSQNLSQIALHIGFVRRVRAGEVVVDFHEERNATYTELTVCTQDDPVPGLLAKITGVLYAANLDVHAAQVLTRVTAQDRIALDTLWIDYRNKPLTQGKKREIETNLVAALTGAKTLEEILNKPSPLPRTKPEQERPTTQENLGVSAVRQDLSDSFTLIETTGPDIRGALFRVARALSRLGWDIGSVRISIWQGAARGSFYVEGARHLSEQEVRETLRQALQAEATKPAPA